MQHGLISDHHSRGYKVEWWNHSKWTTLIIRFHSMRLIPTAFLATTVALASPAAAGPLAYAACQTGESLFLT